MSNLSLYHANILDGATLSATNLETLSSVRFATDQLASFKMTATGVQILMTIDQPGSAIDPFQYILLIDHTMGLGELVVRTYPTQSRATETVLFLGTLTSADPNIIDLGLQTGKQYIDVELTASGTNKASVGELMLAPKFDSPQRPQPEIETTYTPRRDTIELQNGEVVSIKHAETVRRKSYTILGLSQADVTLWIDIFKDNEGVELVVLVDDEGATYPAYMGQEFSTNKNATRFSITLSFTELKL